MTFRDEIQAVLPDLLTDHSTRRRLPVDAETLLPRWRKRQAEQADLDAARWRADEAARKNGVSYDPDAYMK